MNPSPRRYLIGGLVLGVALALAAYGALHLTGYRLMRHEAPPAPSEAPKELKAPLCYVSPTDPSFVRFVPGKDDKGQDLVPVYPTAPPPPGAPSPERVIKYWVSPMDPKYIRTEPGKDYMGHDLVPVYVKPEEPAAPGAPKKGRKIKYWVSPMDPGYVRDQPGKAPCGMDLVPVYEEEGEAAAEGTIAVDPNILQSMGVRTAKVEVRPLSRIIRAVGKVTYNERQLYLINTKVGGWVERLYVKAAGDPIRKGQPLLSIYSPELVSTQREYLLALRNLKSLEKSPFPEMQEGARRLAAAARQRLKYWDIPDAQIAALERTGEVKKDLTLNSPAHGVVVKRMVTEGQMVQPGMPLLEVADLSTVWVEADIYEYELPWVKVGQHATMTLTYIPGETFHGKVDYLYPYLAGTTRTAKIRMTFPNPGIRLKPDMFAQVEIASPLSQPTVVVPAEAILDTGEKQHVFVALGKGRFEPREVKVGLYGEGGLRQVLSGLREGEEVVTSAQFLLDSESRFREAIAAMLKAAPPKEGEKPPAAPPPVHKH